MKGTERKRDLFCAAKIAQLKVSHDYENVTPLTSMVDTSAHMLDPFRM